MAQARHLLVDCDDVLLDWIGGFSRWLRNEHGLSPDEEGPGDWDMSTWLGVPYNRSLDLVRQFNASAHFGTLAARLDAQQQVPALARAGYRMTVITSCSAATEVIERRHANLESVFGPIFDRIICLPMGESKAPTLAAFEPAIWIEDNYRNAVMGAATGHRSIVMRRPHNRSSEDGERDDIEWVNDWSDIASLIKCNRAVERSSDRRYAL